MSQLRQFSWYIQAFYRKHKALVVMSVLFGVLIFGALSQVLRLIPGVKRTTYIGRVGRFSLSALPRDIQEKVSVGLTKTLDNGDVVPALATSFSREENGKAYRFTLRPNIVWQDGKTVTSSDVNYSFSDVEVARSQNDVLFRLIAKKQTDAVQEPVLPVSFLTIVSQPLFRQEETRNILFQKRQQIIGLGTYRITSLINQGSGIQEMTLESDQERLVYRFYPTEESAIIAFKHGDVDALEGLIDVEDLRSWPSVKVTPQVHSDQYVGVFFNLAYKDGENVVLASKTLRQALNYALAKPTTNRIISPINKTSWAYVGDESDLDTYDQDMKTAVDLLLKSETPTKLNLTVDVAPAFASFGNEIKKDWEELGKQAVAKCTGSNSIPADQCANKGIQVELHISGFIDTQNYEVMVVGQQIPKDPDQYNLWDSTQVTNVTHYKNPRVDKLLEDARQNPDRDQRKLMYQEFERTLVKESPVIFLQDITTFNVARKLKLL